MKLFHFWFKDTTNQRPICKQSTIGTSQCLKQMLYNVYILDIYTCTEVQWGLRGVWFYLIHDVFGVSSILKVKSAVIQTVNERGKQTNNRKNKEVGKNKKRTDRTEQETDSMQDALWEKCKQEG